MRSLKESRVRLTHTVRLLVGSDEESENKDFAVYLASHEPPDLSLVLDAEFPVVIGEKAWNALSVTAELEDRPGSQALPYRVLDLDAGLSPSIVPDRAEITLRWSGPGTPEWAPVEGRIRKRQVPEGTKVSVEAAGDRLVVRATGKAAHGGVNSKEAATRFWPWPRPWMGICPRGGADDLLGFARMAGKDLNGTGLGLTEARPGWGGYSLNVATIKPPWERGGPRRRQLTAVTRRPPPLTGAERRRRRARARSRPSPRRRTAGCSTSLPPRVARRRGPPDRGPERPRGPADPPR